MGTHPIFESDFDCLTVEMRKLVPLLISSVVLGVDRGNFKTCKDSSFCERQRRFEGHETAYKVTSHQLDGNMLKLRLEGEGRPCLAAEHTILAAETARVTIEECEPLNPRYQVASEVLVDGDEPVTVELVDDGEFVTIKTNSGIYMKTSLSVYVTQFGRGETTIALVNSRNMLNVEELSEKGDEENWEEKFKTHKDPRPRGPEAVAMDVTFVGSRHLYGLPEHTDSFVLADTTDGEPYRLWNLDVFQFELDKRMALYGGIPFVTSHTPELTTGALWLNAAETWVDVKYRDPEASMLRSWFTSDAPSADTFWLSETGKVDLFLMAGPSIKQVNDQYTTLTGRPQMPPQWATAYHQCKWNYRDMEDVDQVNKNFDEHDIPCDCIWLDIEHTNGKRYFTWDQTKFDKPLDMIDGVASKGRKMVTIVDPHIKVDNSYKTYTGAKEANHFVKKPDGADFNGWCWPGNSAYIDFTSPAAREWWADQFKFENYIGSNGNLYTWNDMNEPSVFNGPEVSMHRDMVHHGGWEHRAVHQIYGMMQHRATFEGHLTRDPNTRPFVLSRAFFAGSQRWGAIWTGDNGAEWGHLKSSVPMLLSLGLSGMSFVGADVGGFFGNPDAELVWRWYQVAAFQPFFRAHAHLDSNRREPWVFEEPWTGRMRDAIRMRYRMLPLWNQLFYEAATTGAPPMRPIWYNYPKETDTFGIESEFMVGNTLLVAPVMDEEKRDVEAYFPPGQPWYRIDDHERVYHGNLLVSADVEEQVPVFIRGGAAFAMRDRIRRSNTLMENDPVTLVLALDDNGQAHGQLYFDDGIPHDWENKNEFILGNLSLQNGAITYSLDAKSGTFSAPTWVEKVEVYGFKRSPARVEISSSAQSWKPLSFKMIGSTLVIRKPDVRINSNFSIRFG